MIFSIKRLNPDGSQQRELPWFRSYLSSHRQFCVVNGIDSDVEAIEAGGPQGSCLGSLLFLIYINDLLQAIQGSSVTIYADNTCLCHQSHDLIQLNEATKSDFMKLETWLQGNKHSLYVAETHLMFIPTTQKHNSLKSRSSLGTEHT